MGKETIKYWKSANDIILVNYSVHSNRTVEIPQTTTNHHKPPQTTPNHRKPPFLYMITVERGGNGCGIATIRAPHYASVGMEGSGKCYRRTRLQV